MESGPSLSRRPPGWLKLMFDSFGAIFSLGPVVATWGVVAWAFVRAHAAGALALFLLLSPLLLVGVFLSCVRLFRVLLPALRPGVYRTGLNRATVSWYGHLALGRAAKLSGLRPLLHSFYVTRFLLYRALGARIAFGIHMSIEFVLADLPLITIGPGCTLGENVYVGCHYFLGDRLWLRPTTIGRDCFIGMNCIIGPGSRIGDDSWIGFGNIIAGEELPERTRLADRAWAHGGPGKSKPEYVERLMEARPGAEATLSGRDFHGRVDDPSRPA